MKIRLGSSVELTDELVPCLKPNDLVTLVDLLVRRVGR